MLSTALRHVMLRCSRQPYEPCIRSALRSGYCILAGTSTIGKQAFSDGPTVHNRAFSTTGAAEAVLRGKEDNYDGIMLDDPQHLPTDPQEFLSQLRASLNRNYLCEDSKHAKETFAIQDWRARKKRGIWLKLPRSHAALVQPAIEAGFDFHHAEWGYVTLAKWLPHQPCTLPSGATHNVGVGAFVVRQLDNRREVLLVQEAHGVHKGKGMWKLPTGLTSLGEDIGLAAEREVMEETGIRASFDKVICIRQSHGHLWNRDDLFFVCGMRLAAGVQNIVLQQDELAAADWHPLEQAAELPIFTSGEMFSTIFRRCKAYADGEGGVGLRAAKLANGFNPKHDLLLF